jgi:hypothetical protein
MAQDATVWGRATRIGEIAEEHSAYGFGRLGAHSYDDLATELPEEGIMVDADHDHVRIGELVYGEITDAGAVNVVCVLDNDRIAEAAAEQPIYFSPELLMVGDVEKPTYIADRAELIGLALTFSPATLGAVPLEWRHGDVRSEVDTRCWPLSWHYQHPLLDRAERSLRGQRLQLRTRHRASHLVDLRGGHDVRPTGPLRYGAPGRILSVR